MIKEINYIESKRTNPMLEIFMALDEKGDKRWEEWEYELGVHLQLIKGSGMPKPRVVINSRGKSGFPRDEGARNLWRCAEGQN
jgi:hypothetical protein